MIEKKLEDFKPMQERCSNCSFCKWIPFDKVVNQRFAENCPSIGYYNFNAYSARGRFQLGLSIVNGERERNESLAEIVHSCLSCGACDVACKVCRYNLEPLAHNVAMKADVVEKGGVLPSQARGMASLKEEGTLMAGLKKKDRAAWADGLGLKKAGETDCSVLFFPGCQYSYNKKMQPLARKMAKLFDENGGICILADEDACCGERAWQQGLWDAFDEHASGMISLIKGKKISTIVTPCSDCYHAFKRLYAEKGLDVKVLHAVEYLEQLIKEGKIKFTKTLDLEVTYHDPCHLGRLGEPYVPWDGHEKKILNQVHTWEPRRPRYNGAYGIYDAPRNVIKAVPGVKLVEMTRIREYSWCCGSGAGMETADPGLSAWTADERMTEALSTGAKALVTACPWCETRLSGAKGENGQTLPVMDVFELVESAM